MQIISEKISVVKCPRCGCVYEWDTEDIKTKEQKLLGCIIGKVEYVECPKCKQKKILI